MLVLRPYREVADLSDSLPAIVETLFLDAGNTLIGMDYAWIVEEIEACGHRVGIPELERAEAAARPIASWHLSRLEAQSGDEAFRFYLDRILSRLPAMSRVDTAARERLAIELTARLKRPGGDHRLWSRVLPGVEQALEALAAAGLRLVVVSNSDGSVAQAMRQLGLASWLDDVLDSEIVGYEKPDPRFFRHALAACRADAGTTLHVGDMYFQDVLGARAAGIAAVLIDPFGDWQDVDCPRRSGLPALAAELLAR